MMDPNFLAQRSPEWSAKYAREGSGKPLTEDISLLYDALYAERKEKITIQNRLTQANRRLDKASIKIWLLTLLFSAEGAALGKLFSIVLNHCK